MSRSIIIIAEEPGTISEIKKALGEFDYVIWNKFTSIDDAMEKIIREKKISLHLMLIDSKLCQNTDKMEIVEKLRSNGINIPAIFLESDENVQQVNTPESPFFVTSLSGSKLTQTMELALHKWKFDSTSTSERQDLNICTERLRVLKNILDISCSNNIRQEDKYEQILDQIISVHSIAILAKGAIFGLNFKTDNLEIRAQRGFMEETHNFYQSMSVKDSQCGECMSKRSIACLDCKVLRSQGMPPYCHYCIPIVSEEQLVGFINLYVKQNHRPQPQEKDFLLIIAGILAVTIVRERET